MALLQCAVSKGPKRLGTFALYQSPVSTVVKRSCPVHAVMLLSTAKYSWKDVELALARFPALGAHPDKGHCGLSARSAVYGSERIEDHEHGCANL